MSPPHLINPAVLTPSKLLNVSATDSSCTHNVSHRICFSGTDQQRCTMPNPCCPSPYNPQPVNMQVSFVLGHSCCVHLQRKATADRRDVVHNVSSLPLLKKFTMLFYAGLMLSFYPRPVNTHVDFFPGHSPCVHLQ